MQVSLKYTKNQKLWLAVDVRQFECRVILLIGFKVTLTLHYAWVFLQLYYLPNMTIRLTFFLVSQLLGGLLIALVVTYNHNSVDKFPGLCVYLWTLENLRNLRIN